MCYFKRGSSGRHGGMLVTQALTCVLRHTIQQRIFTLDRLQQATCSKLDRLQIYIFVVYIQSCHSSANLLQLHDEGRVPWPWGQCVLKQAIIVSSRNMVSLETSLKRSQDAWAIALSRKCPAQT